MWGRRCTSFDANSTRSKDGSSSLPQENKANTGQCSRLSNIRSRASSPTLSKLSGVSSASGTSKTAESKSLSSSSSKVVEAKRSSSVLKTAMGNSSIASKSLLNRKPNSDNISKGTEAKYCTISSTCKANETASYKSSSLSKESKHSSLSNRCDSAESKSSALSKRCSLSSISESAECLSLASSRMTKSAEGAITETDQISEMATSLVQRGKETESSNVSSASQMGKVTDSSITAKNTSTCGTAESSASSTVSSECKRSSMSSTCGGAAAEFTLGTTTDSTAPTIPKISTSVDLIERGISWSSEASDVSVWSLETEETSSSLLSSDFSPDQQVLASRSSPVPFCGAQTKVSGLKYKKMNEGKRLRQYLRCMKSEETENQVWAMRETLGMIKNAWNTPSIGRDLAYGLCEELGKEGGVSWLMEAVSSEAHDVRLEAARLLEQSMTLQNRERVVTSGLEKVVKVAVDCKQDAELGQVTTGILESLFKHSEDTCTRVIELGGLDAVIFACRSKDVTTLRHAAMALANLTLYGGEENHVEMLSRRAADWLFPLAFASDPIVRYYACLAAAALAANRAIAQKVENSGTLELVTPFLSTHNPVEFADSETGHSQGRDKQWLARLVPMLSSVRPEPQSLAAFHFTMEAHIKAKQDKTEILHEIGVVEPLKRLASSRNEMGAKLARMALKIIGEDIPRKLSLQVHLWCKGDIGFWCSQVGFPDVSELAEELHLDGDLLLQMTEDQLTSDLNLHNGILRQRFWRELVNLQISADYSDCDPSGLDPWMMQLSSELSQYTYRFLRSGVDRELLEDMTDEHLRDLKVTNPAHRLRILRGISGRGRQPSLTSVVEEERTIDVFISYRHATGGQLASLLKVHLQLRGYVVFLDIERLRAGKFDESLLHSVSRSRHFILVLTPQALDRCIGDGDQKDWVHKEIYTALSSECNIIPVMDNFDWPQPDLLPDDMRIITRFNGIRWIHDYQEAGIDKIVSFFTHRERKTGGRLSASGSNSTDLASLAASPVKPGTPTP